MARDKIDIKNFMGVIRATEQTEDGVRFPGALMPSGNPVVGPGASLAQLMSDKAMAETWHQSIVGQYESEKEEANHSSRTADTPDLVIGGEDGDAGDGGRGSAPVEVHREEVETELAGSVEDELRIRLERVIVSHEKAEEKFRSLSVERTKLEAALQALEDLDV